MSERLRVLYELLHVPDSPGIYPGKFSNNFPWTRERQGISRTGAPRFMVPGGLRSPPMASSSIRLGWNADTPDDGTASCADVAAAGLCAALAALASDSPWSAGLDGWRNLPGLAPADVLLVWACVWLRRMGYPGVAWMAFGVMASVTVAGAIFVVPLDPLWLAACGMASSLSVWLLYGLGCLIRCVRRQSLWRIARCGWQRRKADTGTMGFRKLRNPVAGGHRPCT